MYTVFGPFNAGVRSVLNLHTPLLLQVGAVGGANGKLNWQIFGWNFPYGCGLTIVS